jgi:drug/metabolite transporter (DMT)-like permease
MCGWMLSIKNSTLSLTKLTALVNVTITFGYFFGLAFFGQKITPVQWSGVFCLIVGIILINK